MSVVNGDRSRLQAEFRAGMARVCTPVAVVTTLENGRPHGTTVSAFASQSMSPPMMLVSLAEDSGLLATIRRTNRFGLNVLASTQADHARQFAVKGAAKFTGAAWQAELGAARLDGAAVWAACALDAVIRGGDHSVLLGVIEAVATTDALPLTYHARAFGTHLSHVEEVSAS